MAGVVGDVDRIAESHRTTLLRHTRGSYGSVVAFSTTTARCLHFSEKNTHLHHAELGAGAGVAWNRLGYGGAAVGICRHEL